MYTAMNHLLTANKENAEKPFMHTCILCRKVFSNQQALGSHLRAHQEAMKLGKSWNIPDHSSTSIGTSVPNGPNLSSIFTQTDNPSVGSGNNLGSVFGRAISPSTFSNRVHSNQSPQLDATRFSENNLRNVNSQFIMSPNLSSGYGSTDFNYPQCFPSPALSPFGSPAPAGFPLDPSYLGSNGGFQYNVGELQSCIGGMPFPSADALQNFQYNNLSNLPYPSVGLNYPCQGLGSSQPPIYKEPTTYGVLSPNPCQFPDSEIVCQYNKSSTLRCEGNGNKRPYVGDVSRSAVTVSNRRPYVGDVSGRAKTVSNRRPFVGDTSGNAETMSNKRPYVGDMSGNAETMSYKRPYIGDHVSGNGETMDVSKKPKISPNPRAEKEKAVKKEITPFNAVGNAFPGMTSSSGKEECEAGLDLSLHL